jgi:hypothetical protein
MRQAGGEARPGLRVKYVCPECKAETSTVVPFLKDSFVLSPLPRIACYCTEFGFECEVSIVGREDGRRIVAASAVAVVPQ